MTARKTEAPALTVGAAVYPHAARALNIGGIGTRVIDAAARAEAHSGVDACDVLVFAVPAGRAPEALEALGTVLDVRQS